MFRPMLPQKGGLGKGNSDIFQISASTAQGNNQTFIPWFESMVAMDAL